MKVSFKPLSLAVAVSAAAAGYAGSINASSHGTVAGNTGLGDAAIVPYYTVRGDWTTGVSIINTSASTQVVKVRLRRATDSMDVLDFNLVLSPEDVWTGYLENNTAPGVEDQMRFYSDDKSCTVPVMTANADGVPYFAVPAVFSDFAEEGYIEIIGMGAPYVEAYPLAVTALHNKTTGIPASCALLQNNFQRYAGLNVYTPSIAAVNDATFCPVTVPVSVPSNACSTGTATDQGVVNSQQTLMNGLITNYKKPGNFMKVSWFIKDTTTGIEMGDNAVMLADFMDGPSMTNQLAQGLVEDLQGYDYPDLNGGAPLSAAFGPQATMGFPIASASDGQYNTVRAILGAGSAINDWSKNVQADLSVDTDWVITVPGQYTMLNLPVYIASITGASGFDPASKLPNPGCIRGNSASFPPGTVVPPATVALVGCDYRDLPLTITPSVYDREERSEVVPPDQIVISPTPPGTVVTNELFYEVNVIQWGDKPVLDAAASSAITVDLDGAVNGWADLVMTSTTLTSQAVCEYNVTTAVAGAASTGALTCAAVTVNSPPIVGFVAWQRSFETNPDANYGRAIRHSFSLGSAQ